MRSRLADYYRTEGESDLIQIDLPKGTYVPVFQRRNGNGASSLAAATSSGSVEPEIGQERVKKPWWIRLIGDKDSSGHPRLKWMFGIVAVVAIAGCAIYFQARARRAARLVSRHPIVLADFTNTTGDAVFDGTLRSGLSAQLEQSPFLNLLSDQRIGEVLSLMGQPKDVRLTDQLALEVCQRTGSAATIEGSIAARDNRYALGLRAVDCHTGDVLADDQVTADGRGQVLKALGKAATKLRHKLGESLASVEKYDAPPEDVTTNSLEALQAYSLGYRAMNLWGDFAAAIPLFQRAISIDPNFAIAYARLGTIQDTDGEEALGKAYELRERVSEREKFYIESHYQHLVTGDRPAARRVYERWIQTYPQDGAPYNNLGQIEGVLGDQVGALTEFQEAAKLNPSNALTHANVV